LSKVVNVSSKEELDDLLELNPRVLVDFSKSAGCVWCKKLDPHFDAASDLVPKTAFVKVDVLNAPELIEEYGFMKVPTVLLFEYGEVVTEVQARTALQIVSEIKR
jgi:thiol-disulfide isomerase/thioredoxin